MRKDVKHILNFVFFLVVLLGGAAWVHSTSLVSNLSLEKKGDFTYFTIFAEDGIQFTHFILPATDGKSHRIVVDLENAIHRLPKNNFRNLPPGTVKEIRTSQFQVEPKKITRIVLDLKEPVIYKIVEQEKENQITLALSTKKDPSSGLWATDPKVFETEKEAPKEINIKREEKKKFARKETVKSFEKKSSKTQAEPKIKDLKEVSQKPQVKKAEKITALDEIKKEKDEAMVRKGIETKTEKKKDTHPPVNVVELPDKEESAGSKPSEPDIVPGVSIDTSLAQLVALPESEKREKDIAERESLVYVSEGKRDPFVPVSQEIDFQFGEIPLPSVENLKLVGTLEDRDGYKALLEDDRGYGYMLKSGDRVKNGFVVNIFKDKIFFQIEEYGWSRMISLELPPEY